MAAPSYGNDLLPIDNAESDTGWDEGASPYNTQGGFAGADGDYPFIQGSFAVAQICTKTGIGSAIYDYGTGTGGHGTDGAYFVWQMYGVNSNLNNYANGGFRIVVGSSLSDFYAWYVGGVDKAPYPYGGWTCNVANTSVTVDDTVGTPGATEQFIGSAVNVTTGSSKGYPHVVDAIRYGRGTARLYNGELADPATFSGFAAVNDNSANRLGLIQETGGGYLWQGRILLGYSTGVYFRDTNKTIFVKWTPKVTRDFNMIEIIDSNSEIYMTGITFQVLDTTTASRGWFRMTNPATVYLTDCNFLDMDRFIFNYLANPVEITGCTFRRCNWILQGGATFDACTFSNSTSGTFLYADDISLISNSDFVSDGTGYGIELSPDHAGNTYIFDGNTFTAYASANGSTGNEAIYNNSGGHVIINLQNTTSIPSYRNGSGATTAVNLSVTLTLSGVVSGSEIRIQEARGVNPSGATLYELENSPSGGNVQWTYNYGDFAEPYYIDIIVHNIYYTHLRIDDVLLSDTNSNLPIQQQLDRWYDNP